MHCLLKVKINGNKNKMAWQNEKKTGNDKTSNDYFLGKLKSLNASVKRYKFLATSTGFKMFGQL